MVYLLKYNDMLFEKPLHTSKVLTFKT